MVAEEKIMHPFERIVRKNPLLLYSIKVSEKTYRDIIEGKVKMPKELIDLVAVYTGNSPLRLREEIKIWERKYSKNQHTTL